MLTSILEKTNVSKSHVNIDFTKADVKEEILTSIFFKKTDINIIC